MSCNQGRYLQQCPPWCTAWSSQLPAPIRLCSTRGCGHMHVALCVARCNSAPAGLPDSAALVAHG